MSLPQIGVVLIGLLHVWFMILEMFLWTKPLGLRTFRQSKAKAMDSKVLAANQGLYNGFLAAGCFWSAIHPQPALAIQLMVFFMICVAVAGIYGALTVSKNIFFVQALPALAVLAALFIPKLWIAY